MSWLFLIYWLGNIGIGFVFFNNSVNWNFLGLGILLLYVDIFFISYTVISNKYGVIGTFCKSWNKKDKETLLALTMCFVAGMIYVFLELHNNGFSLSNLSSLSGLSQSGNYFTTGRYGGSVVIHVSTLEQICLTINYSGFVLAGYVYKLNILKKKRVLICFIQFIPMILSMLATTAKTTFISGIILWISGYFVASNFNFIKFKIKKMLLIKIIVLMTVAFLLFYLSFYIRYDGASSDAIVKRIAMYAFGHVPCFDSWFEKFKINMFGYSHGEQTFMVLFGDKMPVGLAAEYVTMRFVTPYSWTNVITMFSYVLMDFGYVGSVFFWGVLGGIAGISTAWIKKNGNAVAHSILGLIYYTILYSFLVSPMRYLSIVGAFILFGVYIFILKRIKVK